MIYSEGYIPNGDVEVLMEKYVPLVTESQEKLKPPSHYLIKDLKLDGKALEESFELDMKIELTILSEKWKKIPLFATKNTILKHEIEKKSSKDSEAYLGVFEETISLLSSSSGTFLINLKISVPYEKSQKREINIDLPISLKNALKLEYKGRNLNIKPLAYQEGDYHIFPSTGKLTVSWEKEVEKVVEVKEVVVVEKIVEEKVPLAISNISLLHQIGEGLVKTKGIFKYTINQGSIISLSLKVQNYERPFRVINVSVRDLLKWDFENNVIEVHFKKRMEGSIVLMIDTDLEMKGTSCQVNIPVFTTTNDFITRESGELGVVARTNVEIKPMFGKFMNPIDSLSNEITQYAEKPVLFSFKYLEKDYQLELDVTRHDDTPILSCVIDDCHYQITQTDKKLVHQITSKVRNTSKQFLRFQLDQDSEVWSTTVKDQSVKPVSEKNTDGTTNILIPISFNESKIVFTFVTPSVLSSNGKVDFSLARVDSPINQMRVSLFLPQNYYYGEFEESNMKEVDYFSNDLLASIPTASPQLKRLGFFGKKMQEQKQEKEEKEQRNWDRRDSISDNDDEEQEKYEEKKEVKKMAPKRLQRRLSITYTPEVYSQIQDEMNDLNNSLRDIETLVQKQDQSLDTIGVKPISVGSLEIGKEFKLERILISENEKLTTSIEYQEMTKGFFEKRNTSSGMLTYLSVLVLLIGILYYYIVIKKFF